MPFWVALGAPILSHAVQVALVTDSVGAPGRADGAVRRNHCQGSSSESYGVEARHRANVGRLGGRGTVGGRDWCRDILVCTRPIVFGLRYRRINVQRRV